MEEEEEEKKIVKIPPLLYCQRNKTETKKIKSKACVQIVIREVYKNEVLYISCAFRKTIFYYDVCNSLCVYVDF